MAYSSCAPLWLYLLDDSNGYEEDLNPSHHHPLPIPSAPSPPLTPTSIIPLVVTPVQSTPSPLPSPPTGTPLVSSSSVPSTSSKDEAVASQSNASDTEDEHPPASNDETDDDESMQTQSTTINDEDTEDEDLANTQQEANNEETEDEDFGNKQQEPSESVSSSNTNSINEAIDDNDSIQRLNTAVGVRTLTQPNLKIGFLSTRKIKGEFFLSLNTEGDRNYLAKAVRNYHLNIYTKKGFLSFTDPYYKTTKYSEFVEDKINQMHEDLLKKGCMLLFYPVLAGNYLQSEGVYDVGEAYRDIIDDRLPAFIGLCILDCFIKFSVVESYFPPTPAKEVALMPKFRKQEMKQLKSFFGDCLRFSGYGLRNRRLKKQNICFFNALLQAFFCLPPVQQWLDSKNILGNYIELKLCDLYKAIQDNNQPLRDQAQESLIDDLILSRNALHMPRDEAQDPEQIVYYFLAHLPLFNTILSEPDSYLKTLQRVQAKPLQTNHSNYFTVSLSSIPLPRTGRLQISIQTLFDGYLHAPTDFSGIFSDCCIVAITFQGAREASKENSIVMPFKKPPIDVVDYKILILTNKSTSERMSYTLVARVYHLGEENGGHYISVLEGAEGYIKARTTKGFKVSGLPPNTVLICDDEIIRKYKKTMKLPSFARMYFYKRWDSI